MLQQLTSEIGSSGVSSKEEVLWDVCRCIAGAVKAKDFSLYIVQNEMLAKYEHGANIE